MPSKDSFIVFSDDWGEHPSSSQHIFNHILKDHKVIWVNTIGMRPPRPTSQDLKKAIKKIKKMIHPSPTSKRTMPYAPAMNLTVLQPPMVPYNFGPFRKLNRLSVVRSVKNAMERLGIKEPVLVTTVPNACDYVGAFNEKRVVYYCVDDFANWPGHSKEIVQEMENELVKKCDLVVATSKKLYDKFHLQGKRVFLLSHGVDLERFTSSKIPIHRSIASIPVPRIGYVGLIDERLDLELLEDLLKRFPQISFVLVGQNEVDLSHLKRYQNFYHIPPCPYEEVPSVLKGLDVGILPYKVNEFTHTISPLKLKEYLAAGLKVMASPLQEILNWKEYVLIAYSQTDWIEALERLENKAPWHLKDPAPVLEKESWQEKAKMMKGLIMKEYQS